jgi:hypothetical protein
MDFIDQLKQFSTRVESIKASLQTEEATKTAIIMPFFAMLGYDVFNPQEFVPEYTADVGTKKGEKVDYAIIDNGNPTILIEAKWIGANLEKHDSQLFRYFGTTSAKIGILTNGLVYKFYTDLETPNKMDLQPFLEVDISDIKEAQVAELKKFHKSSFDVENVINSASELKYSYAFKELFAKELQNPSDDLLRLFLTSSYSGMKTQVVLDKFRPILKKSLNQYISEIMNDKIKSALSVNETQGGEAVQAEEPAGEDPDMAVDKIVTTQEELEAFYAVKSLLVDVLDAADIVYKDTESYMTICFKGMVTKWICRLYMNGAKKQLVVSGADKSQQKFTFTAIDELFQYREVLQASARRFAPVTV